ncbi:MAG: glycosyltransferase family 2 protein [Betaproteobacteria bacterium]
MPTRLPCLPARPSVSCVLPMFNEGENIGHALEFLTEALERHASAYEVIVVDDASTDDSAELVRRAAERNPNIRLLRHDRNRKLGATIRTGFRAATKDVVLYTDADLPVDPDVLGRALRAMRVTRADVIAAYRFDRVPEGLRRSLYSRVYNALIGTLFQWPFRDINFAFKLFRREVLEAIDIKSEGSLVDAELIIKAKNCGFRVQQIGVDYFPRTYGQSHLSSPGVILRILVELIRFYPDMRRPARRTPPASADEPGWLSQTESR